MAKRKTIKTKQRRQLRLALAFLMLSIITVVSIVLYLNTDFGINFVYQYNSNITDL